MRPTWSPAISLLAARSLGLLTSANTWVRHTAVFALLGLITCSGWRSYTTKLPAISDFGAVAQFVQSEAAGRPVLYCCRFDGEFIFERRRLDPWRRSITLRADKMLVNFSIQPYLRDDLFGREPHGNSRATCAVRGRPACDRKR